MQLFHQAALVCFNALGNIIRRFHFQILIESLRERYFIADLRFGLVDPCAGTVRENISLEELKKTWMAKLNDDCLFISAREKMNVDELRDTLYAKVRELHVQKYPYNDFLYPIEE